MGRDGGNGQQRRREAAGGGRRRCASADRLCSAEQEQALGQHKSHLWVCLLRRPWVGCGLLDYRRDLDAYHLSPGFCDSFVDFVDVQVLA